MKRTFCIKMHGATVKTVKIVEETSKFRKRTSDIRSGFTFILLPRIVSIIYSTLEFVRSVKYCAPEGNLPGKFPAPRSLLIIPNGPSNENS